MAFGKKPKPASKGWECGCQVTMPARILYCQRCGRGQPKTKEKE